MNRQNLQHEILASETSSQLHGPTESDGVESVHAKFDSKATSFAARDEQQPGLFGEDELLTSLSSAHENLRARQVFEWEAIRRRAESNATARYFV